MEIYIKIFFSINKNQNLKIYGIKVLTTNYNLSFISFLFM